MSRNEPVGLSHPFQVLVEPDTMLAKSVVEQGVSLRVGHLGWMGLRSSITYKTVFRQ